MLRTFGGPSLGPQDVLAIGEATLPRAAVNGTITLVSSGNLVVVGFTAQKSEPVNATRSISAVAAGATPTLCRIGFYSVDNTGAITLLAATANDPTLWAAASTTYTRALLPIGSAVKKVAGQRYALGYLCVTGSGLPTLPCALGIGSIGAEELNVLPPLCYQINGQADLPASAPLAAGLQFTAAVYGVVTP